MVSAKVTLKNESGLHARPATQFVSEASKFKSEVKIKAGGTREVNGKSIMGILSLGIASHMEFEISAHGEDEHEAVRTLKTFIEESVCD